jgi:hypothetical protein
MPTPRPGALCTNGGLNCCTRNVNEFGYTKKRLSFCVTTWSVLLPQVSMFEAMSENYLPWCHGLFKTFHSMSRPILKLVLHSVNHSPALTLPWRCGKREVFHVPRHTDIWRSRGTDPLILNRHQMGVSGQFLTRAALPLRQRTPEPTE